MHFQFDYFCRVATNDEIFCCHPLYYKTTAARILHTKFDKACDVIFMVSK